MKIESINLVNFRNYEKLNIEFDNFLNIFYGKNGSGKTNLIEAIYLLSLTKSFRISNDKSLIRKGNIKAKVRGEIRKNGDLSIYTVAISNDGKTVEIDDNRQDKISDYVSRINVILFNPVDTRLIDEAPAERRKLLNIEISQLYKEYLVVLANYNRILKQRNFYLRSMYINGNNDTSYLDIVTKKLVEYGVMIAKYRKEFIENINKYITDIYASIFKTGELKVKYVSSYKNKNASELLKSYQRNYRKEMEIGKTLLGVHHDDIEFDFKDIQEIRMDLTAQFVIFGIYSEYVFHILLDCVSPQGTYKLKVKNKDDFIHIIDYFHQNHVKVIDPRHIEDAYHQYPDDYSRQKYYKRTHKDLLKKK